MVRRRRHRAVDQVRADPGREPAGHCATGSPPCCRRATGHHREPPHRGDEDAFAEGLGFLNTFLLVFAGISLFVGVFIIVNTFSMLVAQRTRELALLRAVGASRGQVVRVVLGEAVVIGLVGGALGLFAGIALAKGLQLLVGSFGLKIDSGLPVQTSTVVWQPAHRRRGTPGQCAPARPAGGSHRTGRGHARRRRAAGEEPASPRARRGASVLRSVSA